MKTVIFSTTADMRQYTSGLDASTPFVNILPSVKSAQRHISNLLTSKIFSLLTDNSLLKEAIANMAMYNYISFDVIEKRTQQKDIYKHELENMKLSYLNYSQGALAELFVDLETIDEWKDSTLYKLRESLLVRDVEEFNNFYPIDNNNYFFTLMSPLQSEVIDTYIRGLDISEHRDNKLLKRSCVLLTLSMALERFDFSVLPHTLRNSGSDGPQRTAFSSEDPSVRRLSKKLFEQGLIMLREVLQDIDDAKKPPASSHVSEASDLNSSSQKFFSVL